MKAIVYTTYGSPDVLHLKEVATPAPNANEVLIRIHATSVSAVDAIFRSGKDVSARLFTGLTRPKRQILGSDLAGEVVATGQDVTRFQVGDRVYGATADFGAYAEYICLPEDGALATIPANVSYVEAAAMPGGALTALPFLRDEGNIQAGDKVLINGASGSVGSFAVQLAKYFGAEVTGVCSTRNVEMVKALGADHVLDYRQEDFSQNGEQYDIIFDAAGKRSFGGVKGSLKEGGRFLAVAITPSILWHGFWTRWLGSKRAKLAFTGLRPPQDQAKDLRWLTELLAAGTLKPVIGRIYTWQQTAEAHRDVDAGNKQGNIVIQVIPASEPSPDGKPSG